MPRLAGRRFEHRKFLLSAAGGTAGLVGSFLVPVNLHTSPNVLFDMRVSATRWLSPGFVRVTLAGSQASVFAARGLDQRVKILLPGRGFPASFDDDLMPELEWRRRWRALPVTDRPVMRSYTPSDVRPGRGELDLDFYVHERPGPASSWATSAVAGDRLLVSGPDIGRGQPLHGVQWRPGAASWLLLAGDETAFPAIRRIASALAPEVSAHVLLEAGDPDDIAWLVADLHERHSVTVTLRSHKVERGARALAVAVSAWLVDHGSEAAHSGDGFYAWFATESGEIAGLRELMGRAGISLERVHSQGYWRDQPRP